MRGFTLIETMIGVLIIVTSITGPLSVAVSAATYAKDTKDKMTAIYLAQEAVDILRFDRDSLLIKCSQNDDTTCPLDDLNSVYGLDEFETISNAAWRMFKENLNGSVVSTPDCFSTDGCSFDFYGFTANPLSPINPLMYPYTGLNDAGCNYLYRDESSVASPVGGGAFLCKDSDTSFDNTHKTKFSRKINLTILSTIIGGSTYNNDYNDDIRVKVTVTYTRSRGVTKTVDVVDFLHAKI